MIEEDHGSNGGDVRLDFFVNQIVDFLNQVAKCRRSSVQLVQEGVCKSRMR